jgi:hypothetical protein
MTLFTVIERRAISDELVRAADRWLARHGLTGEVDGRWLELVCEDGDVFTPEKLLLHLAVPPCAVAVGDSVEAGRTQTVGRLWPDADAPPDEVPKDLALARTFEHRDGGWVDQAPTDLASTPTGEPSDDLWAEEVPEDLASATTFEQRAEIWVGACELPGPVRELFTVEHPEAMLSVMNATRRTLGRGAMSISGDPSGQLWFTLVEDNIAAWGSTAAGVPEAFTCWLDAGPAIELATPLEGATRIVGSLGGRPELIIANEQGVEARCPLDDERPAPVLLPRGYFENSAQGRAEGLRIDRQGGLGRAALAAIANLRPGEVAFALAEDAGLVICAGPDDADAFELDGPGFAPLGDRPSSPIVVPYVVALALYDGAIGGTVDLTVDARWGRLHRTDHGITVQWRR